MRPLFPLLALLAVFSLTGSAWAGISASGAPTQDRPSMMRAPPPAPADKPAPAKAPKPAPTPAAAKPPFSPLPSDLAQCRLDCARPYYFCLASEDTDGCGSTWVSCRAACDGPSQTPEARVDPASPLPARP